MQTLDEMKENVLAVTVGNVVDIWVCSTCSKKHKDSYAAQECCMPTKEYGCSVCSETFWRAEEAEEHIKTPHSFTPSMTPEEIYIEGLRFGKIDPLELQRQFITNKHNQKFDAQYSV